MPTFKYIVVDHNQSVGHATEFDSSSQVDYEIVYDAAEYHHDNCDGVHDIWPLTIEILSMDNESLGIFEVEREFDASFYPTKQ